ncbi:MAG: helix-turn-helix transcriptional regulator [Alphaproteobacteria bacterium]
MAAVLGLAMAAQTNEGEIGESALGAIQKIVAASPLKLQSKLRDIVAEAVQPEVIEDFDDLLEIVSNAIDDERKLRIVYLDQTGEASVRTIRPLAWAESKSGESIAAWCELRGGFRHFRADRIDAIAALQSYFKGERDVLLDRYLKTGGD